MKRIGFIAALIALAAVANVVIVQLVWNGLIRMLWKDAPVIDAWAALGILVVLMYAHFVFRGTSK